MQKGFTTGKFLASGAKARTGLPLSLVYLNGLQSLDMMFDKVELRDEVEKKLKTILFDLAKRKKDDPESYMIERLWYVADKDGSGSLSLEEVKRILRKMNINMPDEEVEGKFKMMDTDKTKCLDRNEFRSLIDLLRARPEIEEIIKTHFKPKKIEGANKAMVAMTLGTMEYLPFEQVLAFFKEVQGEVKNDLEGTIHYCTIINPRAKEIGGITPGDFKRILAHPLNEAYDRDALGEYQDMTHPMSEYFINSSHNTYLEGNQLTGTSSANAYINVLCRGCKLVEIDCWDGPDGEPIVTHGHTLTSKILFRDVIQACKDFGFSTSPYPVILTLEMHCGEKQQIAIANILKEILGDNIALPYSTGSSKSPGELQGKFIVRGKGGPVPGLAAPDDDEMSEEELPAEGSSRGSSAAPVPVPVPGGDAPASPKSPKPSSPKSEGKKEPKGSSKNTPPELAGITAMPTSSVKKGDFDGFQASKPKCTSVSFVEHKMRKFIKTKDKEVIRCTQNHVFKVYPIGTNVDSSNFNPILHWCVGNQICAMNFQSGDYSTQVNFGKFRENGNSGYIHKPPCLLNKSGDFSLTSGPFEPVVTLRMKVISCVQLPKPNRATKGEIIDPYVEVEVAGIEKEVKTTKTIDNNGFNPIYNDEFTFNVKQASLAFLKVTVWDADVAQREFVGKYVVPVTKIRKGYRSLPLYDAHSVSLDTAHVFVQFY